MISRLSDMELPQERFAAAPDFQPERPSFVTQDEIDHFLTRGSGISEGEMRIYSYYMQGHNAKECADFLKNEYGIGGYGYLGYNEWHDTKGIRLTREDEVSGFEGYDTAFLNWNRVEKRIAELIRAGRYLNPEEQAHIPDYERMQLARKMNSFYYFSPHTAEQSPHDWDFSAAEKEFFPKLKDPVQTAELLADMESIMERGGIDKYHAAIMQSAIADLTAYQNGTYSLFTPLPAEVLQAERDKKEQQKQAKREKRMKNTPVDELTAAARALSRKKPASAKENADGQLSMDDTAARAAQTDENLSPVARSEEPDKDAVILAKHDNAIRDTASPPAANIPEEGQTKAMGEGEGEQAIKSVYNKWFPIVVSRVLNYEAYQNACRHSDEQNAKLELHEVLKQIALDILPEDTAFYNLYFGMPGFTHRLTKEVFEQTYPELSKGQENPQNSPADLYHKYLFKMLDRFYGSVTYYYLRDNQPSRETGIEETRKQLDRLVANMVDGESKAFRAVYDHYPLFSDWMASDIYDRVSGFWTQAWEYGPDLVTIHANDTNVPEWVHTGTEKSSVKSFAGLYRDALSILLDVVQKSALYSYLRDKNTGYDEAKEELEMELTTYIGNMKGTQPTLYDAYTSLPMFADWLIEDILERTYQDVAFDTQDAIARHAGEPGAPEWARPEKPVQENSTSDEVVPDKNENSGSPDLSSEQQENRSGEQESVTENSDQSEAVKELERLLKQNTKPGQTYSERNYRAVKRLFPGIVSRKYTSMRFQAGDCFMPLCVEWIGENELSIAHYHRQNGDTMADPEMTFRIDFEKETLEPLTYQQDNLGLYQRVYPEPGIWIPKLRKDLNSFAQQWFRNIKDQNYLPEHAVMEVDGNRTEVTFQGMEPVIQKDNEPADIPASVEPENEEVQADIEQEGAKKEPPEPDLTPNVEEYLNLKAQYPDKLVCVRVNHLYLLYGKDAETAASALDSKLLAREISGLGEIEVTGSSLLCQSVLNRLLRHGHSVVIAQPDPERGAGAPYEIIKERDIADYIPIGMSLTIDGRHMRIDSIDYESNRVSLRDLDMPNYPIFREESVSFVRECVEKEWSRNAESDVHASRTAEGDFHRDSQKGFRQSEPELPAEPPPPEFVEIDGGEVRSKVVATYSKGHPFEAVVEKLSFGPERHNFHITDDNLGVGGQKAKYQFNIAAIRTLKQIEAEGRTATPEEQEILSRYVGWGALANAFDPQRPEWAKEYEELKSLLTPEEYDAARSSVLSAYYTSPTIIKSMYQTVQRMGFTQGNILEPAMGTGNFFGLLPESMEKSRLYGVEIDSITGRIAKQLYPNANIQNTGYEKSGFPDNFFDLAVGNIPYGSFKVDDKRYNKLNLNIHDYFITKMIDQVRPGGVIALVTSWFTMDKKNSAMRQYIANRAELLGAVRLPNNAFLANAGTGITADILFFQKRDRAIEVKPDWVNLEENADGFTVNKYFADHPEMILGILAHDGGLYGDMNDVDCKPFPDSNLSELLTAATAGIQAKMPVMEPLDLIGQDSETAGEILPADPKVRNFSFTLSNDKLYFRENSRMKPVQLGKVPTARVKGMIDIRDSARKLIDLQLQNAKDEEIKTEQGKLNRLYDSFTKKHGLLNSAGNRLAFIEDSSYPLLCSLEMLDEDGNLERKADMFTKRTIKNHQAVTSVDTAVEALGVSIGEKACVDLGFMASLVGGSGKIPQIVKDLKGIIFKDPDTGSFDFGDEGSNWADGWQTADEYLSGDVRKKLAVAREAAEEHPEFAVNAEKLEQVQPKDLTATEISVRIGAPWIDIKYYKQFLFELLGTPEHLQNKKIDVLYSRHADKWGVTGKSEDSMDNTLAYATYGTKRANAYSIFEDSLNQINTRVFDKIDDKYVLNETGTEIASAKQEALEQAFKDWIFKDPQRRTDLCETYNRMFNSVRPREFDGKHIQFAGMNPEKKMRPHQRNAIARILYGGNSLLAHCVGAGKTYAMAAGAMESKRLGLCQKSLFVVPNHLTEQWGGDFSELYPGAKVLVATKKDFEKRNRRKFCAKIATGDYDAVIIGHSQFGKIPLSPERQKAAISQQIDEILDAIEEAKEAKGERFTIKQLEKSKKSLEARLQKLHDKKTDDTVTFEELGIDRLFIDEAQEFKNLYLFTKMRNVAGISQTDSQKASDMYAKCRYLDEITGGRGITFATGTPISNSMVELYTMMRYLQYDTLQELGLGNFDAWAANFGEKTADMELKPEGTGYRLRTRFAHFYNLPELMTLWKEATDIQTADMLKLPVPEAKYEVVQTEPSEAQKQMVQDLAARAEAIRNTKMDPKIDNMLKITSDGRKLALDQRLMNPLLPDDPGSKVNACVENVFSVWQESAGIKGTQLIFSDLSTPKGKEIKRKGNQTEDEEPENGEASEEDAEATRLETSVYEDIRRKLIAKGIPAKEIAFIHDAKTDAQKAKLFADVRAGRVRVLLGSTQKMGAGTNVQTRLVASHDLDCPWRPSDLEQRAGRIIRQGNWNEYVKLFRYVTKGTFDAYNWALVESKQRFIGQIMTSKCPARSIEDVDATSLSYAEVKMLATGDPLIREKMGLEKEVKRLKIFKANHMSQKYELEDKVIKYYPQKIKETGLLIDCLKADLPILQSHPAKEDAFSMTVMGKIYTERKAAGEAVIRACKSMTDPEKPVDLGEYRGFPMKLCLQNGEFQVKLKQSLTYTAVLNVDILGNITRMNNALEKIPENLIRQQQALAAFQKELENAKQEAARPFPKETELQEKSARLLEVNAEFSRKEKEKGQQNISGTEGKPSIRDSIKNYGPSAPASPAKGRGLQQEAIG